MNINLVQPIYDTLQMFFPSHFFTNPFFSFLIDCLFMAFGTCLLYIIFILPIKYLVKAFRGRYI